MARSPSFGLTPWGAYFARAIEGYNLSGRLDRGKSYADNGKVTQLRIEDSKEIRSSEGSAAILRKGIEAPAQDRDGEGRFGRRIAVLARVEGHSKPWYRVRIEFGHFDEPTVRRICELIESEPLFLARIEAGELSAELLDLLQREGIDLIPRDWNEMRRRCDCPDWGDPCKHMAAVYYMLAKEIDRDPGLLFRLRGLDLTERFRLKESAAPGAARGGVDPPTLLELLPPASKASDAASGAAIPSPEPPSIASYTGYISALLPRRPSFCPEDFSVPLLEFYHRSTAACSSFGLEGDVRKERVFSDSSFSLELVPPPSPGSAALGGGRRCVVAIRREGRLEGRLGLRAAAALFLGFESAEGTASYRYFFYAFRALRAIVAANAFAPVPLLEGSSLSMLWRPLPSAGDVARAIEGVASLDPGILLIGDARAAASSTALLLATAYATDWTRGLEFRPTAAKSRLQPFLGLFFQGHEMDISRPGDRGLARALASWLAVLSLDFKTWRYRITLRGIPDNRGAVEGREEVPGPVSPRRYALGVSVLPGKPTEDPAAQGVPTRPRAVPLKDAVEAYGDLAVLRPAAALSAWLPELGELATKRRVELDESRLAAFLAEAAGLLSRLGAEVVLPRELHKFLKPRLVLTARAGGARNLRSMLDLESLLRFDWRIAIGDESMDAAAFAKLVRSGSRLVAFRDGYVLLDPEEAARLLAGARSKAKPTAIEALAAYFSGESLFSSDVREIIDSLLAQRDVALPVGLAATLRPYQERGFRWACSNLAKGLGCVMADDMGLGKTVQAIGVMQRFEEDGLLDEGALVVVPAALLLNWERELRRFAPCLTVARYHGPRRSLDAGAKVLLTTYQTAVRDIDTLRGRTFSLLVADEAHLLKNASTRQSRALKELPAARKLALSGTPVENRLEDLRSLFDLVLPGYLGGPAEFRRRWRLPIEVDRDLEAAADLRRLTAPFLMRRLKTDKAIVPELPDKVVTDEFAALLPAQAALYESVVRKGLREAREASESGDDAARRALVLKLITSLKEICDHPRVYDRESPAKAALSGKCLLLLALLEEILAHREKVLVFSQYVEALKLLAGIVEEELGERALVYHGGMSEGRRNAAVDEFQTEPGRRLLLVSLRAGGLGLNLTAASQAIHFDLWFNPAVENQATDRLHRIGQTRKVFVHRFVTTGTFEERIDAMIKSKRELADMSVSSGETWLSELRDEELAALFERS